MRKWTEEQRNRMWLLSQKGKSEYEIAKIMKRTPGAIRAQIYVFKKRNNIKKETSRSKQLESETESEDGSSSNSGTESDNDSSLNSDDSADNHDGDDDQQEIHQKPRLAKEVERLKQMLKQNKRAAEIGEALCRSESSGNNKRKKLRGKRKRRLLSNESEGELEVAATLPKKRRVSVNEQRGEDGDVGVLLASIRKRNECEGNINSDQEQYDQEHDNQDDDEKMHMKLLLEDWNLEQYYHDLVIKHKFDDLDDWRRIEERDLKDMGIPMGHRRRFLRHRNDHFVAFRGSGITKK